MRSGKDILPHTQIYHDPEIMTSNFEFMELCVHVIHLKRVKAFSIIFFLKTQKEGLPVCDFPNISQLVMLC